MKTIEYFRSVPVLIPNQRQTLRPVPPELTQIATGRSEKPIGGNVKGSYILGLASTASTPFSPNAWILNK